MSNIELNAKASFFVFAGKFSQRLLGLVSTLVLARLLSPSDFGLVALVWLVLRSIDAIAITGAQEYITQKATIDNDDLNTAWTINILIKILVVVSVVIALPFVSAHYDEPRLYKALPVLALVLVLGALVNPYTFKLRRERQYRSLFKIDLCAKIASVITTIVIAVYLRNYWALIVGHLVSTSMRLFLSFYIFSYRPAFTAKKLSEQLAFSKWMFLGGVFGYLRANLDLFLVSQRFGVETLGGYHVSKYIAMMPGADGVGPAVAPLLASFSSVQDRKDELLYQIKFSLLVLMSIVLPLSSFMYVNAFEVSQLLLGNKWSEYISVFSVLCLLIITIPLHNYCVAILLSINKPKIAFCYDLGSFLGLASLLFLVSTDSVLEFAWWKTSFELICVSLLLVFVLIKVSCTNVMSICLLIAGSVLYTFLVGIFVSNLFGLRYDSLASVVIEGSIFLCFWAVYCQVVFKLFFKGTTMGFHILHLEKAHMRGYKFFSIFH